MTTRCKPGDLAIVVHAQNPSNLGLIVRVEGPYRAVQDTHFAEGGVVWECSCARSMTWVRGGQTVHASRGPIPDSLLQPVRGLGMGAGALHGQAQERSKAAPTGASGSLDKLEI